MTPDQPNYAESPQNFADLPPLQLTLRVMQQIYSNPKFWIGFVAVIGILTLTGPFDTLANLKFAPRLVYWGAVSLLTFPTGMACSIFFGTWFSQRNTPEWLSRIVGGLIGGIPIGFFVWLVNKYIGATEVGSLQGLILMMGYTIPISAAVSILYYLIASSFETGTSTASSNQSLELPTVTNSAFFKRLPVELGKDIISLQAQDHYIKVTTTKGSEMILLRLADAEAELSEIPGIRVHRSWWIAQKHAKGFSRKNSKQMLELSNGESVPVSRSYAKLVKDYFSI